MTVERGEIVWTPPADVRSTSRVGEFLDWLAEHRGLRFDGYADLWRWSVDDLDGFWSACAEWSGVRWHDPADRGARRSLDAGRAVVPRRHAELRRAGAGAPWRTAPTRSR